MHRSLRCISLLAAVTAVLVMSCMVEDVEGTPRFFYRRNSKLRRQRVRTYRNPYRFRYFFGRYYRKVKPPKTDPTEPVTTVQPTMCAPVQMCNITDQLDGITSPQYSALFSQSTGVARLNVLEVVAELALDVADRDCASQSLSGNVLTATFLPSNNDNAPQYQLTLVLNDARDRALMANFTTRDLPAVGQLRVELTYDAEGNVINTLRMFRPPGETRFFIFPLQTQTCATTVTCGVDVTQPPVTPTEPEPVDLPDPIPMLQLGAIGEAIVDIATIRCTGNMAG